MAVATKNHTPNAFGSPRYHRAVSLAGRRSGSERSHPLRRRWGTEGPRTRDCRFRLCVPPFPREAGAHNFRRPRRVDQCARSTSPHERPLYVDRRLENWAEIVEKRPNPPAAGTPKTRVGRKTQ